MVKWDTPNFFEMTDHKFSAVVDNDNIGWIQHSIGGYEHMFHPVKLDWTYRMYDISLDRINLVLCNG